MVHPIGSDPHHDQYQKTPRWNIAFGTHGPFFNGWSNPSFFCPQKKHGLFVCKDHAWFKFVCKFREVFPWFRAHKARRIANKRDNPIPIGKAAIIQLKKHKLGDTQGAVVNSAAHKMPIGPKEGYMYTYII